MKKILIYLLITGLSLLLTSGCVDSAFEERETLKDNNTEIAKGDDRMQILIQGNHDEHIIFQLNESKAATSLYDQLPMSIDVENYSTNEKIFYPSKKLNVSDAPLAKGPAGTLAYYEPWGDVVIFYDDCGGASGLYSLGEAITGVDLISQLSGTIEITKYSGNEDQKQSAIKQNGDNKSLLSIDESSIRQTDHLHHINITVGTKTFTGSLYDNLSVRELMKQLPMTLQMGDLNHNEKYYYLSDCLPVEPQNVTQIHTGDLKLFGTDCFVLFYKDFSTSYSYTPLGQVDDPKGLAQALGSGNIEVAFDKIQ